jgi:uncharacterized membrane protein
MNKYNLLGAVAVIAILATFFAAWAKLTHQPFADTALAIGLVGQAIALAAVAWLLFSRFKIKK